MHLLLDWDETEGLRVIDFRIGFATPSDDARISNVIPRELSLTVEIPADSDNAAPGHEFFEFASKQHAKATDDKITAKLRVYRSEDIAQSVQEIELAEFWIKTLELSVGPQSENFYLSMTLAVGSVTISDVHILHPQRHEHFLGD
jgi:hypothetical protein